MKNQIKTVSFLTIIFILIFVLQGFASITGVREQISDTASNEITKAWQNQFGITPTHTTTAEYQTWLYLNSISGAYDIGNYNAGLVTEPQPKYLEKIDPFYWIALKTGDYETAEKIKRQSEIIETFAANTAIGAGNTAYNTLYTLTHLNQVINSINKFADNLVYEPIDTLTDVKDTGIENIEKLTQFSNQFVTMTPEQQAAITGQITGGLTLGYYTGKIGYNLLHKVSLGIGKATGKVKKISEGHAFDKHVIKKGEFKELGIETRNDFANHIDNVVSNAKGMNVRQLSGGRTAYWDDITGTVVIKNPSAQDMGTAFRPTNGRSYFKGLE